MTGTQPLRLGQGGRIDRRRPLAFEFDGKALTGYAGDTLASALLAGGVRVVGRSFKFHRPRGLLGAGAEECNALVTVGRDALAEPNVRATLQPLYEGLVARSQNCWPSVDFDLGRTFDYLHRLLPAGFYNKTFTWPNWHFYEGAIRRAAGLGRLPPAPDPDHYRQQNVHCDVLVVGSGPAGLAAALAAAGRGARVLVLEQDTEPGGSALWRETDIDGQRADVWLAQTLAALAARDNVTLLTRTAAVGWFDHRLVVACETVSDQRAGEQDAPRQRLWKVHARETVLATGAIEQPLVFPNNDRPGVMLASAVEQYCRRFAVAAGQRVVIATSNAGGYGVAAALIRAGVTVAAIVDSRARVPAEDVPALEGSSLTIFPGATVQDCRGDKGVRSVMIADSRSTLRARVDCDCVAMAGGWQPAVHLFSQARGTVAFDAGLGAFVPATMPRHVRVAGMLAGTLDMDAALAQGREAGLQAADGTPPKATTPHSMTPQVERVWVERRPDRQWLDFLQDVTLKDVDLAVTENFTSIEHMKRYTTGGMGADQGKTGNLNILLAAARRTGREPGAAGTTTFRPFYMPLTLGAIAGRNIGASYAPVLRSPLHECHRRLDASFGDYGSWRRPRCYRRDGESGPAAIAREVLAARRQVVLFDGSPLGKIEVRGRDAAEFLDRVYVNAVKRLAVGRALYGMMLNENGVIIDDGILARAGEDHFLVHTTSGAARRIHGWLEALLQGDWPELEVLVTPVTAQWANIAVSGPEARRLLQQLDSTFDFDGAAFPHMSIRTGEIAGVPARVLRASFTGELGYEINVPASHGAALWTQLLEAGQPLGATPLGVEALMVLRVEKGYLHVGSDTDGNTTPRDIGWPTSGEGFLGWRSLQRSHNLSDGRLEFVGIRPADAGAPLKAGAHVLDAAAQSAPAPTHGYVTSACYSPNLECWLGLGLVKDGRRRLGERVNIFDAGAIRPAVITDPRAWDPEGSRLRG